MMKKLFGEVAQQKKKNGIKDEGIWRKILEFIKELQRKYLKVGGRIDGKY